MPHVDGEDDGVGYGVFGHSPSGNGVRGSTGDAVFDPDVNDVGVYGTSKSGSGVHGDSNSSDGVFGHSKTGIGVFGRSDARFGTGVFGTVGSNAHPDSEDSTCVFGDAFLKGTGVRGKSGDGTGVFGESDKSYGVRGKSGDGTGVFGESITRVGVVGVADGVEGIGVWGETHHDKGGAGVVGKSKNWVGVYGESQTYQGVTGVSTSNVGVAGISKEFWGVYGRSDNGYAAWMDGKVRVTGYLYKGGGGFEIDHPLDPANKYLYHSFVESPDMKNMYDGVVVLDDKGEAEIEFPDWFGALNKDFRYQLTAIGAPGPNLYIAEQISDVTSKYGSSKNDKNNSNSRFKIAGGTSGMKVSWQVTGVRKDHFANAHRIQVVQDKPDKERGYYTHPDLYGEPAEKGIRHLFLPAQENKPLALKT